MDLGETRHGDRKGANGSGLANELHRMVKTIRVRTPIGHALRRIAAECDQIFNSLLLESCEDPTRFRLGLADDRQVAHDLQTAAIMDGFDQINGFFARASARPVRNRTKARVKPPDNLNFAKEVFLAFFCLWRKEFYREGQPRPGIEVG